MSIDPKTLDAALAILKKDKRIGPRSKLFEAVEALGETAKFGDEPEDVLEAIADAALKALASSAPPAAAPRPSGLPQRGGAAHKAARCARGRISPRPRPSGLSYCQTRLRLPSSGWRLMSP